jgi:hypothetical protein
MRPENNISSLVVQIGDWQSKNYSDVFDTHTTLQLDLKCAGRQTYTTTFAGIIHDLKPSITPNGEDLIITAWGNGIAFAKTHCDATFGAEVSAAVDTSEEILDYIIANHVNKRFGAGGAATQWGIDTTDIDAPHADFTINHLNSQYLDNFTLVNRLSDLINAHAVVSGDVSVHWYVDPEKHFRMKEIDADAGDAATKGWYRYYGGSATTAVMKEGVNQVESRGFHKHINDYANHILVAAGFRKPGFDYWSEDNGPTWGTYQANASYSATAFLVGSHSLRTEATVNNAAAVLFYPSTHDAGWNLNLIGSEDTIPTFNLYVYADLVASISGANSAIVIGKDWNGVVDASGNDDRFYILTSTLIGTPLADKWYHISVPIGPYAYKSATFAQSSTEWLEVGTPNWNDIDFIALGTSNIPVPPATDYVYWDDVHFSGKIVRSCYDTSEITAANKERQVFLRLDNAVDDTLIADDDDAGLAAMVALSELYRRKATPTVGTLSFPCKEDMLPGQTLQVYAGLKADKSTYRWSNLPMRIKELFHTIDANGYKTTVQVTSDVSNTFAPGVPSMWGQLLDATGEMGHGQAKNLKMSGVDNKLTRLGWDPT